MNLGGDEQARTVDPLLAKQVLFQLSYTPVFFYGRKLSAFETATSFHLLAPSKLNNSKHLRLHSDLGTYERLFILRVLLRKEVIQPHLPIRLPCYDLAPIITPTFGHALLAVRLWTSGVHDSHGLTGGVYKARERIHRGMLIRDY